MLNYDGNNSDSGLISSHVSASLSSSRLIRWLKCSHCARALRRWRNYASWTSSRSDNWRTFVEQFQQSTLIPAESEIVRARRGPGGPVRAHPRGYLRGDDGEGKQAGIINTQKELLEAGGAASARGNQAGAAVLRAVIARPSSTRRVASSRR